MHINRTYLLFIITILIFPVVSGEIFTYGTSADRVEIGENFEDILSIIQSSELSLLQGTTITTNQGSSSTSQYIKFGDTSNSLQSPKQEYIKSTDGSIDSFTFIDSGNSDTTSFFEYELTFSPGLKSSISTSKKLSDFEDEVFRIFADDYRVVNSKIDESSAKIKLIMSTSAIMDYINEGESKAYTIGEDKYEISVGIISSSPKSVVLTVNGQDIGNLEEDDYYELEDDTFLGVRTILTSSGTVSDVVSLFIGAKIIELEDHYNNNDFEQGFSVNRDKVSEGLVSIKGSASSGIFTLTSLKYRAFSPTDIYVAPGKKLSETLENSASLFGNWDIYNDGFSSVSETQIIIDSTDDFTYDLTFENQANSKYKVPLYQKDGSLGDLTKALHIVESSSITDYTINLNDYFILSTGSSKNDKSYAVQYDSASTNSITFTELLEGTANSITETYNASGAGTLTIGGNQFDFYVDSATGNKLAIDLNMNGNIQSGDSVDVITKGGGKLDLGTSNNPGTTYNLKLTTESSSLEEATTDEAITFDITGGTQVGITSSSFTSVTLYNSNNLDSGMSIYGVEFLLSEANSAESENLIINYPLQQRFANIRVELLQTISETTSKETTTITNTCTDGIQNGDETGVDCGGSCSSCTTIEDSLTNETLEQIIEEEEQKEEVTLESQCSFGCLYIDEEDNVICLKPGENIAGLFCKAANNMIDQKKNGELCSSDKECISGTCEDSKCGLAYGTVQIVLNILLIILLVFIFFKIHIGLKKVKL